MKRLFLIKNPNGNIRANFNYQLDKPEYTPPLSYQFAEKEKQGVSRLFDMNVYLKFGNTQIINGTDSISVFFPCDFSNIDIADVKNAFNASFPVIIVKEE